MTEKFGRSRLQNYFCDQTVRFVDEEELLLTGKAFSARKYEWLPSDKDLKPEAIVWLDEHNILLRQQSLSVGGDVMLTQYARRPEVRLS